MAWENLNPKTMTDPYTALRFAQADVEGRLTSPPHRTPKDRRSNRSAAGTWSLAAVTRWRGVM